MNNLQFFSNQLTDIEKEIKSKLSDINEENFPSKLSQFGYTPKELRFKDLATALKEIEELGKATGVYVFKTLSSNHMTKENWNIYKDRMDDQNNKVPNWNENYDSNNKVFYLGKSNDIKKRIKEHVEKAAPSTYALKLECFRKCSPSFKYKVHIFYSETEPKDKAVNELVESVLHEKLKPNIGTSR